MPDGAAASALDPAPPADPAAIPPGWLRLAEAVVFAAAAPVAPHTLASLLPEGADVAAVIAALRASTAGRGVELVEVAGGVQFRTAPDLAPSLRKVVEIPRRLPRVAMETLAIVAYHQPVTRAEIEEIRGASLSQSTLDALLEADLIAPRGRRDTPGRPTLWATTPAFLTRFGLSALSDLPRREELMTEPGVLADEPAPAAAATPGATPGAAPELAPGPAPAPARTDPPDPPG
ncbi:MAG: SMC-Scp complex subunit ScpB [Acetobacteraceae bacterium]